MFFAIVIGGLVLSPPSRLSLLLQELKYPVRIIRKVDLYAYIVVLEACAFASKIRNIPGSRTLKLLNLILIIFLIVVTF